MPAGLDGKGLFLARRNRNVSVDSVGGDPRHRTGFAPKGPAEHADVSAIVVNDLGNVESLHFLIPGSGHLERRRKICPQLKSVHPSGLVTLRHLLVDDPAARRHPLHVARGYHAAVAHPVAILDPPPQTLTLRLNSPFAMP